MPIAGRRRLPTFVFWMVLTAGVADGSEPVVLTDAEGEYPLGLHLEILPDPDASYSIAQVSALPLSDEFIQSERQWPVLPPDTRSAWVRFTLSNNSKITDWIAVAEQQGFSAIELYLPGPQAGTWVGKSTGDRTLSVDDREVPHRYLALRIRLEPQHTNTFYMRFDNEEQSADVVGFPLNLWSERAFERHGRVELVVLGIYYGGVVVMALYNLFLFLSLRDRAYLYYVLMIVSFGVWFASFNGIATMYLWPDSTWVYNRFLILLTSLAWFAALLFVRTFLTTQINAPRMHRVFTFMLGANIVFIAAAIFDVHRPVLPFYYPFTWTEWFCVLAVAILRWRSRYRPARYFLIAWAAMICSAFALLFVVFGLLPKNFLTWNGFQLGHALEVILLSLALGDRINLLRREKEAQEAELQTAHDLQVGLMPTASPQTEGFDIAGKCIPATHVGGDFFQYFQRDGSLSVGMADVTGHGMEAAIPLAMFNGVLTHQIDQGGDVDVVFEKLNHTLIELLDKRTYVCFVMGQLDTATRRLTLANAACPFPYHYVAATDTLEELEIEGLPLGTRANNRYPATARQLQPGDVVVFCSDGVIEAADAQERRFGFERTAEAILHSCRQGRSAVELVEDMIVRVEDFVDGTPQGDDQTVVVLRVTK